MCVLNFDTMELKELRREKGVFSIQFLGGTKDYQIYSVQEDNGIKADSGKLRQLSLSEELLKEDFVLNGMLFKNEEGLGFEYTQYLDMDQINWYGYISWEDLLSDENNVKVLIERLKE